MKLYLYILLIVSLVTSEAFANQCLSQDYQLDFELMRHNSAPRHDEQENYRYYPATQFYTGAGSINSLISSESDAKKHFFLWANRCHNIKGSGCGKNPKGNLPFLNYRGKKRFYFSSVTIANMCTLAQTYRLLGLSNHHIKRIAKKYGFRALLNQKHAVNYFKQNKKFHDACYIYGVNIKNKIDGIVLDYEVQDNRHPNETKNFIARLSSLLKRHNKELTLWTNTVGSTAWVSSGFDHSNAQRVFDVVDRVSLQVYSGTRDNVEKSLLDQARTYVSNRKQFNRLKIRKKFYVMAGLGGLKRHQAQQTHDFIKNYKLYGLATWNNGARFGTNCNSETYLNLECLIYGQCHP